MKLNTKNPINLPDERSERERINQITTKNESKMKKLLAMMLMLLPMVTVAQNYYEPSEIDAMWRVWDSSDTFNWLLESGEKVNVSINPKIQYTNEYGGSNSMYSVTEATVCFVRNNKLLALTFSKSQGIRLYTERNIYKLADTYSAIGSLVQQYWFNIDFEHIVYNSALDWLLIPCGYYEYTGFNAIAINFNTESGINNVYSNASSGENEIQYFNIQGMQVDKDTKGQFIIKMEGNKVSKYINR